MLNQIRGDILKSLCLGIVIPVNCVGVLGKGLALQAAQQVPGLLQDYKFSCLTNIIRIGHLHTFWKSKNKSYVFFPTKKHWRNPSQIEWIEDGLKALNEYPIKNIAVPLLGCGLGGLQKKDVLPLIEHYTSRMSGELYL